MKHSYPPGPLWALLCALALLLPAFDAPATPTRPPTITAIQVDANGAHVVIDVPEGIHRIVLETTRRNELAGWSPKAVRRLDGTAQTLIIDLPADAPHEMVRVRADEEDPVPAAFYQGTTNISPIPVPNGSSMLFRNGALEDATNVPTTAPGGDSSGRAVVESDIWKVQNGRLFFFNQFRGLQLIDVANPDAPRLTGSLPFAAAGEQLYVPDDRHAVLLLREDCRGNGYDGAAIAIVDVSGETPREITRLPVPGRIFESRMIGSSLYVASQTYEVSDPSRGVWEMSTVLSSFDLTQPATPVARSSRRVPGSATVVSASGNYFFVGLDAPRTSNPNTRVTELHILDASSPDGSIAEFTTLTLSGYLRDKFKLDLRGDVLRLVVEDQATPGRWSPITRLTTWRLSHDATQKHERLGSLDLGAGENLFGTRFDGDRAYVVTYLRVDPLFIVDLSDPTRPAVLSELKIPGWSNYLHPMGDRLLTVGIDDTAGWRAAVQLFDVADASNPTLLAKIPLGDSWSSSEANWDEKALGVFPTEGLVLLPFSGSTKEGTIQGVQAIDLSRDTLKARGVIEHQTFAPRRSTILGSRVLSLSGRELITADITDRDQPVVTSQLELSRPVDRLVVAGDHFVTFYNNQLQVSAKSAPDLVLSQFDLGKPPVIGAERRGDHLYLLQGTAAEVSWHQEKPDGEWITSTNSGMLQLRVFSLAELPKVAEIGQVTEKHRITGLSDSQALWPTANTLVWASNTQYGYWGPWLDIMPATRGAFAAVDRGFWPGRWWWGQPRTLVAFDLTDPTQPTFQSTVTSSSGSTGASTAFRGDGLILFTEQFQESKVTGTNQVVWTETYYEQEKDPSGNIILRGEPRTRLVTNWVEVVQWWQRYELRVVDYAAGGREPVVRPALAFPGELRGIANGGAVLFSVAQIPEGTNNITYKTVLDASAYDGLQVYVGDSLTLAQQNDESAYVQVTPGGQVVVASGTWNAPEKSRLRLLDLEASKLVQIAEAPLAALPQETRLVGDALLIRESGPLELWDLRSPRSPTRIPTVDYGCIWFDLQRATGSPEDGYWAPGGEYGALRLAPR